MEPEMDEQARLANELKEKANQSLTRGAYSKALRLYTRAIEADAGNAVLYSNRAAAHYQAGQFQESLEDAESAILCDESWWKGHKRKAQALVKLDRYEDAIVALEEGISAAPDAVELAVLLASTRATLERLQTMYVLPGPEMMKKLDSVPVFLVTDQEGQPFFITYDDGTQACTIYFDPTDAQATLEWIQKENGPQGEKAILAPLSLTQAFALAQDTQQQYLDDEASATAAALKKAEKALADKAAAAKDGLAINGASKTSGSKNTAAAPKGATPPADAEASDVKSKDEAATEVDADAKPDAAAKSSTDAAAAPSDSPVNAPVDAASDKPKEPEKEQLTPLAFQFRPELRQVEAAVALLKAMPPVGEDGQPLPTVSSEEKATDKAETDKAETSKDDKKDMANGDKAADAAATPSVEATDSAAPAADGEKSAAEPAADAPETAAVSVDATAAAADTDAAAAPAADDAPKTASEDAKDAPVSEDAKDAPASEGAKDAPVAAAANDGAAAPATAAAKDGAAAPATAAAKDGAAAPAAAAAKDGASAPAEEELTVDNFSGIPVFQAKGLTLLQNNQQNVPLFFSKWDLERSWSQLAASNPGEPLGELEIDVGTLEDVLRRMAESSTKEFDPVIFVPSREALKFVGREFPLEDLTGIKPPPPPRAMSEQGPPPKNLLQLAKMMTAAGASTDEIREAVRLKLIETREQQRLQDFLIPAASRSKKPQKSGGRAKKASSGGGGNRKQPSGEGASASSAPVSAC
ncbi:hypothetical protein MMPV_003982 [Pyropia vietnamensis]